MSRMLVTPLVAVELLDGVTSILLIVEDHDTGSLGTTVRTHVDVCADDVANLSCD
jgi:hypothetical protein